MDVRALFGISVLLSFLSCAIFAGLYLVPRLRQARRNDALAWLVSPHMFFRFIGISFLIPGVVSPELPTAFAVPAAYGDMLAGLLAIVTTIALGRRAVWAVASAWIFNIWGAADLLFAFYQGPRLQIVPGMFGAAFFIPTAIVPPLLVTHALIFWLLLRPTKQQALV
jgi:hypothetical protein